MKQGEVHLNWLMPKGHVTGRELHSQILTRASNTRNIKLRDVAASVSISGEQPIVTYFDQ